MDDLRPRELERTGGRRARICLSDDAGAARGGAAGHRPDGGGPEVIDGVLAVLGIALALALLSWGYTGGAGRRAAVLAVIAAAGLFALGTLLTTALWGGVAFDVAGALLLTYTAWRRNRRSVAPRAGPALRVLSSRPAEDTDEAKPGR